MRIFTGIGLALQGQRGFLFPWVPVLIAIGIGGYFLVKQEPSVVMLAGFGAGGLLALAFGAVLPEAARPVAVAVGLCCLGFAVAGGWAHRVSGPVIDWRFYGAIEGRVVGMDRSVSDRVRLTLDQVVLERVAPERVPRRVRVSLHGDQFGFRPAPHMRVILTGHLAPPSGPVEPGGFDFQRHAWFQGIGAMGYTRTPVLVLEPPPAGVSVLGLRMGLSEHIRATLGGEAGGFAAAVTTGDRSGVSKQTLEALRASNLAHLLAISGLHMGLLVGFVFAALRYGMALSPSVALRLPTKKLAAVFAMGVAGAYLMLSGGNVATERAFVMAAVALAAVVFDRRAISLRAVAIAAVVILLVQPEAMLGPGFQMSFAATTALVAVFETLQKRGPLEMPRWVRPAFALCVSSFVAGAATAPFGAAHFNAVAAYGLPANLMAVPIMGVVVVPFAVVAACLSPFGLEVVGLVPMGWGLEAILRVAHFFAGLEGARLHVPSPTAVVLPLFALGALFLVIWQGRLRVVGILPVILAAGVWGLAERPHVLIADSGGLVGVLQDGGRALSKERGQGFVAQNWLENDGDGATQAEAALRWQVAHVVGGRSIRHLSGKRQVAGFDGCKAGEIVVLSHAPVQEVVGCDVLHPEILKDTGSVALSWRGGVLQKKTAREISGRRLWNTRDLRQ
ncbi:ComEC family competence protein [Shimia sp. CNT1-13L.2]|uniref:ComEC/Rec2 family competence protein n=1 Tax=Shimia sp. CNT1-13L.2 TaxID=2959663 RepID=UPI0020CD49E7|nr:ComEC/Rec2 family competence protein [Shimia sp. CNT1-13L.2]MCP9483104.1 ComEC family competence protein [Shimia sp. CNT1-13L.2]